MWGGAPMPVSPTARPCGAPQALLSCLGPSSGLPSQSTCSSAPPTLALAQESGELGVPRVLGRSQGGRAGSSCLHLNPVDGPLLTHSWLHYTQATSLLWPGGPWSDLIPRPRGRLRAAAPALGCDINGPLFSTLQAFAPFPPERQGDSHLKTPTPASPTQFSILFSHGAI